MQALCVQVGMNPSTAEEEVARTGTLAAGAGPVMDIKYSPNRHQVYNNTTYISDLNSLICKTTPNRV